MQVPLGGAEAAVARSPADDLEVGVAGEQPRGVDVVQVVQADLHRQASGLDGGFPDGGPQLVAWYVLRCRRSETAAGRPCHWRSAQPGTGCRHRGSNRNGTGLASSRSGSRAGKCGPRSSAWYGRGHLAAAAGQHRLGAAAVADIPATVPLASRIVLLKAQVISDLLFQRGLDHGLSQLLQQAVRPCQGQPLLPGQPDQLPRGLSLSSGLDLLAGHVVQCRGHHGTSRRGRRSP
jgi:hypothetical protein